MIGLFRFQYHRRQFYSVTGLEAAFILYQYPEKKDIIFNNNVTMVYFYKFQ
jgi:hypothetical protein